MSTKRKRCLFCGHQGKQSLEHLLPDWAADIEPTEGTWVSSSASIDRDGLRIHAPTELRGHVAQTTAREVCKACNTGWMSDIERATQPIIRDLIGGTPRLILPAECATLAAWAFKTAAVYETTDPRTATIREVDRRALMDSGEPPALVQVSAYRAHVADRHLANSRGNRRRDEAEVLHGQSTAIQLSTVVLHVYYRTSPEFATLPVLMQPASVAIWPSPPGGAAWPPRVDLTYAQIRSLAETGAWATHLRASDRP